MWYYACGPHTGTTVKATILPVKQSIGTAAAETADQTPITPSSHPSSPISPSSPLSIHSDISSTSSYHPSSPLSTSSSIIFQHHPFPNQLYSYPATPTQTQLTHPIQLHGIDLPSVSQYEYLGVIIDDLLTLSPWLAKKKRAITAAAHSISPLLRNNALSPGGNSTLARRLQAPVNTGIRMILKAPLFTLLPQCSLTVGSSVWTRMPYSPRPAYSQSHYSQNPSPNLLLPSTIPSHSSSWFWTRRSRSLIRFVHPNMSLFHFNIPISTNGLFHNPISTNSSITSSNINPSSQTSHPLHISNTTTSTTIPITQPSPRFDTSAPSMHSSVHSKSGASPNWPAAMCRQPRVKCKIFALAGPQYWPGHRGLSPLTGPLWWPMGLS
ncbi:hypothetical protein BASA83_013506 [Batrachochytrium salamandrivorans]|nr:hypothetical protein BASA83_013506 [Batrachochytrium salamandrivorans]